MSLRADDVVNYDVIIHQRRRPYHREFPQSLRRPHFDGVYLEQYREPVPDPARVSMV